MKLRKKSGDFSVKQTGWKMFKSDKFADFLIELETQKSFYDGIPNSAGGFKLLDADQHFCWSQAFGECIVPWWDVHILGWLNRMGWCFSEDAVFFSGWFEHLNPINQLTDVLVPTFYVLKLL